MDFHKVLQLYRQKAGFTQPQVAKYLSEHCVKTTVKTISQWETGYTRPDVQRFMRMCHLYGVGDICHAFLGLPQTPPNEVNERNLLAGLNQTGRKRAMEYIGLLLTSGEFSLMPPRAPVIARTIPLFDMPVSAGRGSFLDSDDYELIEINESIPLDATYALRISGDSMEPRFVNKQIVYVRRQQTLNHGEIGIFLLNGEAFCKRFEGDQLMSLNQKYPPISVTDSDDFRVYGKVVA